MFARSVAGRPGARAATEAGKVDRGHRGAEGVGEQRAARLPRQGVRPEPVDEEHRRGAVVRACRCRAPLHRVQVDAVDLELVRTARVDRCRSDGAGSTLRLRGRRDA